MTKRKIVVALGGNALGDTPEQQINAVKKAAHCIADLVEEGNEVLVGHGNGPQVGMINLAMNYAADKGETGTPCIPFAECNAMSEGYIGYHILQAIENEFQIRRINEPVATIATQVEVDPEDPAFADPTKPVGAYYNEEQAKRLQEDKGYVFKKFADKGYRRIVPSPLPQKIVELDAITRMANAGILVITVGGGGIPVVRENNRYVGVSAVIDKDRSCAKLAIDIDADALIILTAVDKVSIHYGKTDQVDLDELTLRDAEEYAADGEFGVGSMLPKVEACIEFVKHKNNGVAIITSLEKASLAIQGTAGTRIIGNYIS